MALAEHHSTLDLTEAGWYPDPDQVHQMRYFNGTAWTSHVTHFGPSPCNGCYFTALD